jgi:hypothetical protein
VALRPDDCSAALTRLSERLRDVVQQSD